MIEKELFKKTKIDYDKLERYGFKKVNDIYVYQKKIINDSFLVEIKIYKNNIIKGKIIDLEFNEEYINHKIEKNNGEFVNKIRNEYNDILNDIKGKCTHRKNFIFEQSNRISNYIYEKYRAKPEFLWKKYDDYAIFRNNKNKKWFSIIMNINKSKLDKELGEIEIINLKINPDMIDELLKQKGFYEAYHMNKKYWITVLLDDTVEDEVIFSLIDTSFDLVN